jgi:hypothetical protein
LLLLFISVAGSGTVFNTPLAPMGLGGFGGGSSSGFMGGPRGANEAFVRKPFPGGPAAMYSESTEATDRERKEEANCANCGAVHDLKLCTGCRWRRFCGPACQREAWGKFHKAECKALQEQRQEGKKKKKEEA